jgi:hypothetical protein
MIPFRKDTVLVIFGKRRNDRQLMIMGYYYYYRNTNTLLAFEYTILKTENGQITSKKC